PIAERLNQLLAERQVAWRDRLLTPAVTLRLFLVQVLSGNVAIAALRQLSGIDFAPSSYCEARRRLPLDVLQSLLRWMNELVERSLNAGGAGAHAKRLGGPRVLVADGSSHSTEDTPEL